jgi:chitodextrinase
MEMQQSHQQTPRSWMSRRLLELFTAGSALPRNRSLAEIVLTLICAVVALAASAPTFAQTQVIDDFNDRGNGGLGANWTTNTIWGSALQIVNHQLQAPTGDYAESLYTATALGGAQYSQVKHISGLSGGVINLVLRARQYTLGGQGDGYIGQLNGFESKWKIIHVAQDHEEVLVDGTTTFANNDTFYFEANGSTLTLKKNGVTLGSTTNTDFTSGDTGVGMYNAGNLIVDDWRGGEVGSSGDTQPPTAPSGLSASAASSSQINLVWSASADNVAVTGYLIERCQGSSTCTNFSQVPATPSGTTYNDVNLSPSTIYRYRIRSTDAAGNLSSYSQIASATTQPAGGAQVTDNFDDRGNGGLGANWTTNTIWGSALQIVNHQLQAPAGDYAESLYTATALGGAQYSQIKLISGLSGGVINLVVRAREYTLGGHGDSYIGQLNGFESKWKIIRVEEDQETVLASGTATFANNDTFYFEANGSTLTLKKNGVTLGTKTDTSYTIGDAGVGMYNTGPLFVDDWHGGEVTSTDTQAPSSPAALTATAASNSQVNLSWSTSTDNVGVTAYLVERCQGASCTNFAQVATPASTTHNDTGLVASTTYRYRVRARDAANNLSGYSPIAVATTTASGGDTQPPSTPTNLSATAASDTSVNVSWLPSTDNVAVTGYVLDRCQGGSCTNFAQIAAPSSPTYTDGNVVAVTTYRYRVRARDAANNLSGYSSIASATTPPNNPNCE